MSAARLAVLKRVERMHEIFLLYKAADAVPVATVERQAG